MRNILVEITDYGAVIHKDSSIIEAKKSLSNCILNPDLSGVMGISPSYWTISNGKIVAASKQEIQKRNDYHQKVSDAVSPTVSTLSSFKEEIYADLEEGIQQLEKSINEIKEANKNNFLNLSTDWSNAISSVNKTHEESDAKLIALKEETSQAIKDIKCINDQIINTVDIKTIALKNDIDETKSNISEEINVLADSISKNNEYISDIKEQFVLSKNDIEWHIGELSYKVHNFEQKDYTEILQKLDTNLKGLEEQIKDNKNHCEIISNLISINLTKQEKQIKYLKLFLLGSVILTIILKVV